MSSDGSSHGSNQNTDANELMVLALFCGPIGAFVAGLGHTVAGVSLVALPLVLTAGERTRRRVMA